MEHASWITDIECIYPTLTHPCHATIATGCWPDRTGITNNEIPDFFCKGTDGLVLVAGGHSGAYRGGFCKTGGADCLYRHLARHVRLRAEYNIGEIWAPQEGG